MTRISPFARGIVAVWAAFFVAVAAVAAPPRKYSDSELKLVARLASRVLIRNHYSGFAPDEKLSGRLYEAYVKALDPGRIYFTDADLAGFEARKARLCTQLLDGDYRFAIELYDLYRTRNREFRKFAAEYLKHDIDFTKDESYRTDRSKAPRPANDAERRDLWRRHIKHGILSFRMLDRILKIEEAKAAAGKSGGKGGTGKDAPKESPSWKKTPVERELALLRDIGNLVDSREPIDILGLYLDSLASALGPHCNYAPPANTEDYDIHMSLTLTGIGVTLTNEDGFIKVVEIVPDAPAARDGRLKVNDRIIAVGEEDGKSTDLIDMPIDRAVKYIRGPETPGCG